MAITYGPASYKKRTEAISILYEVGPKDSELLVQPIRQ